MSNWCSNPLDLNSIHEEGQLEEEMEDLNSIHEEGHLEEEIVDLNFIHEEGQLEEEKRKLMSVTHQEGSLDRMNDLHSPTRVRSRGRPRKRLGSTLEKEIASSSNKKKRKALSEVNVENSRPFD
ncbi:hypothetical protein PIB30_026351 [Stylosanthes scabra]|uniref:Uncharacterized protein n=1 Tax=Stylosanthes scabra TaxID=79078 RepID=A0ABU6ZAU6_9FABA|nr:hypothetical protein [Stylosanthes scabra]